jgi:hypothetical protein
MKELGEASFSASLDIEPCETAFSGDLREKHQFLHPFGRQTRRT